MSSAAELLISSNTRPTSAPANRLWASMEPGSSAKARSKKPFASA